MKIFKTLKWVAAFVLFMASITVFYRHIWLPSTSVSMEYVNQSFRIYHHNDLWVYAATDEVYIRGVAHIGPKRRSLFQ